MAYYSPQGVGQSVKKWMLSHSLVWETVTGSNPAKGCFISRVGGPMFANKNKNKNMAYYRFYKCHYRYSMVDAFFIELEE